MESLESQVRILIERTENFKDQLNRFVSHLESEQRVTGNISTRVGDIKSIVDRIDRVIERHERILLNDGKGMIVRIDRLEQMASNNKSRTTTWISVVSLLTSIGAFILMFFK